MSGPPPLTKFARLSTSWSSREMPDAIGVPNLIGLTQSAAEEKLKEAGLVVGTVRTVSSATTPSGKVNSANPAAGELVSPGSAVNLEVSSGPISVEVPKVIGLTRPAAEAELTKHGLVVGAVKIQPSDSVAAAGISSTNPAAGEPVSPGSTVHLEVSSGPGIDWSQKISPVLFAILGITVLVLIGFIIFEKGHVFLSKLADKEVARGLITFLIAFSTVGIAVILAISTVVVPDSTEGDKRFDRGKQVLSVLIGVLGTIVGFYFGSTPPTAPTSAPTIITGMLPDGSVNQPYPPTILQTTGLTTPLKWSVAPALPPGIVLDAAGAISGTPTAALPKTQFTFTVTDSAKPSASSTTDLKLEIK